MKSFSRSPKRNLPPPLSFRPLAFLRPTKGLSSLLAYLEGKWSAAVPAVFGLDPSRAGHPDWPRMRLVGVHTATGATMSWGPDSAPACTAHDIFCALVRLQFAPRRSLSCETYDRAAPDAIHMPQRSSTVRLRIFLSFFLTPFTSR